jgi:cytochrome P450
MSIDEKPIDPITDYDIFDPGFVADPYPVYEAIRSRCPIAHTERHAGSWMPTTYEALHDIAHDVDAFSSRDILVFPRPVLPEGAPNADVSAPPISSDPPVHQWARKLVLPFFSPGAVRPYEEGTRALCHRLIDGFVGRGHADVAADYAQQIPVRVIAIVLGVPAELADTFTGWVRDVLEFAHDEVRSARGRDGIIGFLLEQLVERRSAPGDDLISVLLGTEIDGEPIPDLQIMGMAALTLIAGVDTTWSAIGSSLWHLATHPDDVRRLVAEPELMPTAVEELLRAFSPVTMARIAVDDIEFKGCPMKAGDKVLLNFPAANRDPEVFERADEVLIDRMENRHVAFGAGIHRCAGSNLARMELQVAIEEWLRRIPEFRLADDAEVTWAGGQVRGPRHIPVVF